MKLIMLNLATAIINLVAFSLSCSAIVFYDDENLISSRIHAPQNQYRVLSANGQDILVSHNLNQKPVSINIATGAAFHDQHGRRLGLTAAHNLPTENTKQFYIDMGDPIDPLALNRVQVIRRFQAAPSYCFTSKIPENAFHDIALFTSGVNQIRSVPLKHYNQELQEGRTYLIRLGGYGKSFSRSLSSYSADMYQQVEGEITFDGGLFRRTQTSRDFYFHFKAGTADEIHWICSPFPPKGSWALSHGDSGAVALTQNDEAIAIARGINYEEFYNNNPQLANQLKQLISSEKGEYSKENIQAIVKSIEEVAADPSKTHLYNINEKSCLYAFTLKEDTLIPSLKFTDEFTPITPHINFIEDFLDKKAQKEGDKEDCSIQ